ncbi:MAG: copper chaperone PCu(A)C [Limimaricola sp.]|uniref:copper chaperone PCu(A)C n=1 Tax=Limimaricola sp. TaxID=2211665 RepID=UPI001DB98C38|nr:copper chaperone PCu(A)C [Limimaricola sp.]MBI1418918.1 copper chaperone PCu(A)C [Limimaricola sp.]
MKRLFALLLVSLSLLVPALAKAGVADLTVEAPWARASLIAGRPAAAYMVLKNTGTEPVTLTGARTPAAAMAMIHKTETDASGTTSMSPAGDLVIAPGATLQIAPGGIHVMLMNLAQPLKEGTSFPLTLLFAGGGTLDVEVPVLAATARGPGG